MEFNHAEFKALQADVAAIKSAVIGNADMNQDGLAQQVRKNTEYIQNDRLFKAKTVGFLAALQVIGLSIFEFIFGKH